jgi:hypothetical protein
MKDHREQALSLHTTRRVQLPDLVLGDLVFVVPNATAKRRWWLGKLISWDSVNKVGKLQWYDNPDAKPKGYYRPQWKDKKKNKDVFTKKKSKHLVPVLDDIDQNSFVFWGKNDIILTTQDTVRQHIVSKVLVRLNKNYDE